MDPKPKKNIKNNPLVDEAATKFTQQIRKNMENIEKKYQKSVTNKLYLFPKSRIRQPSLSESDSSSEDEIPSLYELKSQNMKNRKGQTDLRTYESFGRREYNSTKSAKSIESVESQTRKFDSKKHTKTKKMEITFESKKKTKKMQNSNKKLLIEQYSLDNRLTESNKKKQSRGLVISFRGTKNQDINVTMSGKRIKTQVY